MRSMLKYGAATAACLVLVAAVVLWKQRSTRANTTQGSSAAAEPRTETIVAPGRVEPISEEVRITSEVPGRLSSVLLAEGERVRRGQLIAVISNEDYRARVASAEAQLQLRQAELARIVNGARAQERREALALVSEAEATLANAEAERKRKQDLYRSEDISKSQVDAAERDYAVAKARYEAAREHYLMIDAPAREDERMRAEASVALARMQLKEAQALLNKTEIRSPINGIVVHKHLHPGEGISELLSQPIYTLADTSVLRVRVDVDEGDIAKVHVGQHAWLTAAAYGDKKFYGRLVRIGHSLGKKKLSSDEPTERVDQKILEVLVQLEPGMELPIGLRMNCYLIVR